MTRVLLTGFEPFGGAALNPSAEVALRLADEHIPDLDIRTAILPVAVDTAPDMLLRLLITEQPDWCVMLGQAEGRAALSLERVAINLCDFSIPDNTGKRITNQPIVADGPAAYFATLPLHEMRDASFSAGVPADLSLSAGTYLCNLVFYTALHACQTYALSTGCGFIHLPALPEQMLGQHRPVPTMALSTICNGLRASLHILAAVPAAMAC